MKNVFASLVAILFGALITLNLLIGMTFYPLAQRIAVFEASVNKNFETVSAGFKKMDSKINQLDKAKEDKKK